MEKKQWQKPVIVQLSVPRGVFGLVSPVGTDHYDDGRVVLSSPSHSSDREEEPSSVVEESV